MTAPDSSSTEAHRPKDSPHQPRKITVKKIASYVAIVVLIAALVCAWGVIDAYSVVAEKKMAYDTLQQEILLLDSQIQYHRLAAVVHRSAIIEEAVREAPAKEIAVKRLALSIALAKNGTGFEDRIIDLVLHNSSEDGLNSMRTSFLSSLFEHFPPALERQEGIQMQMDGLMLELQAAGIAVEKQGQTKMESEKLGVSLREEDSRIKWLYRLFSASLFTFFLCFIILK